MGSTASSQPTSEIRINQEMSETSQLLLLPDDVLIRILKHFDSDVKTLLSRLLLLCKSSNRLFGADLGGRDPYWNHISHIRNSHLFSRGDTIVWSTLSNNSQQLCFRADAQILTKKFTQPAGIRIHVLKPSGSEETHMSQIFWMSIEFSPLHDISHTVLKDILKFLGELFESNLGSLKFLRLSGFPVSEQFPLLPENLEELSLHSPYIDNENTHMHLGNCDELKKKNTYMLLGNYDKLKKKSPPIYFLVIVLSSRRCKSLGYLYC